MKGIIFDLLEKFVVAELGEDAYEEILDSADLETKEPFVGPGSYPDGDLLRIVGKVVDRLGIETVTALRAFGRFCILKLAGRFPTLIEPHADPVSFLRSVNDIHFVELRKLYDDAAPPRFEVEEPAPDRMILRYHSARALCPLVEGLVDGVADHYGVRVEQQHDPCMLRGADECVLALRFSPLGTEQAGAGEELR